ncbi:MAG: aconitate hydratase [Candidatus Aminicenantes bacterium RBG_16_63_16]|nr:MAG: aconitate hydratase [Candidatus Aminicenantes bacterium RBG_16_63_16]
MNLTHKILASHLVEGSLVPGEEIAIRIDQTLLQDATGTMAMLEFESLGLDGVRAELCAQYIDHNLLQTDSKNADDHLYLQTACQRYGLHCSRPGNGVSHQVHMERFGVPGKTLLGADSHTPGGAGASMLAIGAGGLDVVLAMAGLPYRLRCPRVLGVRLTGELKPWVSAKDVILEMLRRYNVKGGVGKIIEYYGPGVATLSASDRMVIGNMGAEMGATTTVFPSDDNTRRFLEAQGRGEAWRELRPDADADYDEHDEIDLGAVEPLIALPSSPGNVVPVKKVAGLKVDQTLIGSSANSGFRDFMIAAKILDGRRIHPDTVLFINPGSRQILENIVAFGAALPLIKSGARVFEPGCLGCIGMGQAPGTGQISLRTVPRNFPGRSGEVNDKVYLCSPETAAASALRGIITDPRDLGAMMSYPRIDEPERYVVDDRSIIFPLKEEERAAIRVIRGPNIHPFPALEPLGEDFRGEVVIKVGDDVSTDSILPAGNNVLPLRSNIDAISEFVFIQVDPEFVKRCRAAGQAVVIGGENYGQGSSREHAALAPRYLGVRVKIVKSFARIHRANLGNFGVVFLTFKDPDDYDSVRQGAKVSIPGLRQRIAAGDVEIPVEVDGRKIVTRLEASPRQRQYLLAGGALNYVRQLLKG